MVVVVVSKGVLAIAVLGLDEERSSREITRRPGAVLRGQGGLMRSGNAAVTIERDVLAGFADQSLVAIKVMGSLGLGQGLTGPVAVLLFPETPIQWVVAVTGNDLAIALTNFDQTVATVVAILRDAVACFSLLNQVAAVVPLITSGVAGTTITTADFLEAVVGVVLPFA